ncbi:poly(A)-specific ribonuclease PARN-like [Uranotaenia lowii]|uniref:poly(A)-specific ribonuclease PARN-like n=1 Tax=Uranotaenia lowii TaxID=190385 RepID=UPI00247B05E4|nr:poly(A)-specific ribonuclease PARN-like [Uranotaenia lowii]
MEITNQNFLQQLPSVLRTIQEADFFAIDGEFTGLTSDRNVFPFDTPEEVYLKTIDNCSDFVIIQLGLCAFRVDPDSGQVSYKCYNFYCFPRGRSHPFACQGDSMHFLAENGFDFNKLFLEGLSYYGEADEERFRADLKDRQEQRAATLEALDDEEANGENSNVNMVPVPPTEEKTLSEISEKIEAFIASDEVNFTISNCNGFQRKLVYQLIETKFKKNISTSSVNLENNHKGILVERKRTKDQEVELEKQRCAQEQEDLTKAIGLSLVLQELSKAKKMIIGHNMLLDLLFIIRQFFRPLPPNYQDFKKVVRELFPLILDTKYLCTNGEIKVHVNSSVLSHVFEAVQKEPFKLPEVVSGFEDHKYCPNEMKQHEAGFDAFLTGQCFLGLASFLQVDIKNVEKDPILKSYLNRIFLLRLAEVNYIYIHGKEPTFSRDHIFYITFPEQWRQSDIVNRFRNYGQVYVNWVSNSSAFVSLHQRDHAGQVIRTIDKSPVGFTICSLNQFKAKQQCAGGTKRKHDSGNKETEVVLPAVSASEVANFGAGNNPKKARKAFAEDNDW